MNPTQLRALTRLVQTFAWALALSCQTVAPAKSPTPVTAAPSHVRLYGLARPFQEVLLKPAVKGTLKELRVSEGDEVECHQVLATLDDRLARAAVAVAAAQADHTARKKFAEHELTLTDSLVTRLTSIGEAKVASEYELDKAIARRNQARETLAESVENQLLAKRKLELEQVRLENHFLRSPFKAKVLRIDAAPGATLDDQQPLLVLVQLHKLKADLHLPVDWFGKMQVGRLYRLQAAAPVNRFVDARLIYSAPVIDAGTRTFRAVFEIPNSDGELPAGFAVTLESSTPLDITP